MVKIINGEIYQDNDPRLQQLQREPATATAHSTRPTPQEAADSRTGPAVAGRPAAAGGFNFNAPPVRFVEAAPGENVLNLPNVQIFGVSIPPMVILVIIGFGVMWGWRGVAVGALLFYIYVSNGGAASHAARPRQPQAQAGGPGDFLQGYLNGPSPAARRGPARGGAQGISGDGPGHAGHPSDPGRPGDEDKWAAFSGRGNKLGKKDT